jgi:hypothetical protein
MFFSLSQSGRVRFNSNTTFSWELVKNFRLNINPYLNYDNQPPEGNSNYDYGTSVGLTFYFLKCKIWKYLFCFILIICAPGRLFPIIIIFSIYHAQIIAFTWQRD